MNTRENIKIYNEQRIKAYWKDFRKSGIEIYNALPFQNMFRSNSETLDEKLEYFKNGMYNENLEERKTTLKGIVKLNFPKEIDYIFDNRRLLRDDKYTLSMSNYKLFRFMKIANEEYYMEFKYNLKLALQQIATSGVYTENEVKDEIAKIISHSLVNGFIIL
jgi:hypothetical protein